MLTHLQDGSRLIVADEEEMSSDDALFAAHYLPVMRLCLSRLHDAADAEDAVQEVFGRAVQHAAALGDDPLPWLITVAKNVCNDELRRRKRALQIADAPASASTAATALPPPDVTVVGRMAAVELLGRLTPGERRAVAARLDGAALATSTTRVLLARARQKLRDYLEESQSVFGTATVYSSEALHRLRTRFFGRALVDSGRAAVVIPAVLALGIATSPANPHAPDAIPGSQVPAVSPPDLNDAVQARRLRNEARPSDDLLNALAHHSVSSAIPSQATAPQLPPYAGPVWGTAPLQFDVHQVFTMDVEPSPNYAQDHTVWMVGQNHSCADDSCSQLWVSKDGGADWTYVPPQGAAVGGHRVLLPANAYPGYFYSFGAYGLQITRDQGSDFSPVFPTGVIGFATQPPSWTGVDALMSVGNTLWSVPHPDGSPQLLSTFGAGGRAAAAPLVLPSGQGWFALQPVLSPGNPVTLQRCTPVCRPNDITLPADIYVPKLLASPDVAVDHTVYLVGMGLQTMVSHDDGATFVATGKNGAGDMIVTRGPRGDRLIETTNNVLSYSDDEGRTWIPATVSPPTLTGFLHSAVQLRPGRLMASAMRTDDQGWYFFICSTDGAAWSLCSPDHG
jgi:DNA-directed RNA polymerase specialized sigma24 family protein